MLYVIKQVRLLLNKSYATCYSFILMNHNYDTSNYYYYHTYHTCQVLLLCNIGLWHTRLRNRFVSELGVPYQSNEHGRRDNPISLFLGYHAV